MECNFRNYTIRWHLSRFYRYLPQFLYQLLLFRHIQIKNNYLQKVGQGQGAQFSQLHLSIANVKIWKCLPQIFALTLTVSDIKISIYTFRKQVTKCNFLNDNTRWQMSKQVTKYNLSIIPLDVKCQNLQILRQLLQFHRYNTFNCFTSKKQVIVTECKFSQFTPFDSNCHNLQISPTIFFMLPFTVSEM